MAIYKRCSRCGKRILEGNNCDCVSKRYKDYDRCKNDVEKEFYKSKSWLITRKKVIDRFNGIDIYSYYQNNIIESGFTVHHIIPISDDWSRRLDVNNLIYLTESNHRLIHNQMKKSKKKKENMIKKLFELLKRFKNDVGDTKKVF